MSFSNYYVYKHVDTTTKGVVYIGMGSSGRAWLVGKTHSPLRSKEHNEWADKLFDEGITADEFVIILHKGLSKTEARRLEQEYIYKYKPIFNKSIRHGCLKITVDMYNFAVFLRQSGMSYEKIAKELGMSTMPVYRALNNKTISLEMSLAG